MESRNNIYQIVSKGQWLLSISYLMLLFVFLAIRQFGEFNPDHRLLALIIFVVSYPAYSILNVYTLRANIGTNVIRLLSAWIALLSILALLGFVTKTSARFSREVFLLWSTLGFFVQLFLLPLQLKLSRLLLNKLTASSNVLIIGNWKLVDDIIDRIEKVQLEEVKSVLLLDNHDDHYQSRYMVLTELDRLGEYLVEYRINKIYLSVERDSSLNIKDLYIELLDKNIDIVWVPDLSDMVLLNHSVDDFMGLPIIRLSESPLTTNQFMHFVKTVLDKTIAVTMLIFFSPLLIVTGIFIKLTSPGPILFCQRRHGLDGKVFWMYKFRSMRLDDNDKFRQATFNDDRVTPIGKYIRKTSIDELPQLINVLKGDMSLVGPRPHAIEMNDYYSNKIQSYMARHRIKPGMTGLAQIRGFRGETETMEKIQERLESDLEYINSWSLRQDFKILLVTPKALIRNPAH